MADRPLDRKLVNLIRINRRLRDPQIEPRNALASLRDLQRWQARRLRESFEDFLACPRQRPAAEFFLSDLYGDFDVSGRDRDVERVLPIMRRVLPERLLGAAAGAIELAVLSHALDLRVAEALAPIGPMPLDESRYAAAYRSTGLRRLRRHQVELIVDLGLTLDRAVSKPMIGHLLRISRGPARAAGLGQLQSFLERGFEAFRALQGAQPFVSEIARRELQVSDRLFANHPRPFALK